MSSILEITQLTNGDVILRDTEDDAAPLISIHFSDGVRDMLGDDLVGVAEAMIDAATEYLDDTLDAQTPTEEPTVVH